MSLVLPAYAKINLFLDVLGKRDDGYHEVEMVMQTISLHDLLEFSVTEEQDDKNRGNIFLTVTGADLPVDENNLVIRAARLLQEYTSCRLGARIVLRKKTPIAAGLGGGSADAATALLGLNRLWKLGLTAAELHVLAEKIGSDVPFCIKGGTALAKGRGENLTVLDPTPNMGLVLVKPSYGISTAQVYKHLNIDSVELSCYDAFAKQKDEKSEHILYQEEKVVLELKPAVLRMCKAIREKKITAICKALYNVLEEPAMRMHPNILDIKRILFQQGAMGVLMSGSGSTVFGITKNIGEAQALARRLNPCLGTIYTAEMQGAREV